MQRQGTGEVSGFSPSFGLQNHALLLLAGLCPADVLSHICVYVIYNLSLSLDCVRAHVSLPPLANSPHLGSAEAMDSHTFPYLRVYPQPSPMSVLTCSTEDP